MAAEWMIDQVGFAGPEHLEPSFVSGYDRKQGDTGVAGDVEALLAMGALDSDSTVVELGAGTGRFALAAAPVCSRVVAVDVSPAMLDHLSRASVEAGVTNLECVRAGFLDYDHRGSPPDAVYTRHALHQLPDFWKGLALHRMASMLRSGGILMLRDLVYDFVPADAPAALDEWMAAAATDRSEGYTREDFATHVRTEFSTFSWLLEPLLMESGFTILASEVTSRIYAKYICRNGGPCTRSLTEATCEHGPQRVQGLEQALKQEATP
jgi:ubiquinone/menaquinone biosynthesis C-methylase UbiE